MEAEPKPELANVDVTETSSQAASPTKEIVELVIPTWRVVVLSISLSFGLFLSLLDTSIVATALYAIGSEFNSLNNVTWVALAYTLSYVGCVVIFARIGDVVGRRNAYTAAFIIFFAFSLGCGFAQSLDQLIACRVMQGIGGSGLYSLTMVILPEISPPKKRKFIGSLAGMVIAVSGVLGPVLGGVITHYTTWRWIFWINAPIGIGPMVLFVVAWPKPDQLQHAERRPFRELDFLGCFLLIAASLLVVFPFQEAGIRTNAWGTAIFIAPLVVGCVCWILLVGWEITVNRIWERSVAATLPLRLLKRRVFISCVLATMLTGFPYFVIIYSLPLRLQVVNQTSPLTAGIGLLPMLGSAAVASMVGGIVSGKKNRAFSTLLVAALLMVIGTSCLSTLSSGLKVEAKVYGFQVFVGCGFGLTVSTVSMIAAVESEIRDHAVAQGIVAQARILGGSIGIAASTAILGATRQRELTGIVSEEQVATLQSSAHSLSKTQLRAIRVAYSDAFNESLLVCAVVAGVCVLVTLGTFQRHPQDLMERRQEQLLNHTRDRDSGDTI